MGLAYGDVSAAFDQFIASIPAVGHGELAPATLFGFQSRLRHFAEFLHSEGIARAEQVDEMTMERFLA